MRDIRDKASVKYNVQENQVTWRIWMPDSSILAYLIFILSWEKAYWDFLFTDKHLESSSSFLKNLEKMEDVLHRYRPIWNCQKHAFSHSVSPSQSHKLAAITLQKRPKDSGRYDKTGNLTSESHGMDTD